MDSTLDPNEGNAPMVGLSICLSIYLSINGKCERNEKLEIN
jgi:hypothetical protein